MTQIPLKDVSLFSALSQEELMDVGQSLRLKILADGDVLFRENEIGDCFYIVVEGEIEVIKAIDTSEERLLNVLHPGDFMGEMSILSKDNRRSASVRAHGDTHLLEFRRENFEGLVRNQPGTALNIIRELSDRLRTSDEAAISDLRQKNKELAEAYQELKEAQAALIEKEKMEHELEMAREIQMNILPTDLVISDGCEIGAKMVPARAVGGDFYDVIQLENGKVGVSIGDVSDKGVPAAMFMAQFCTLLRAVARQTEDPAVVLTQVNNSLLESNLAGMFVTGIYGVYEPASRAFTYARAGHEVPVIFDQVGNIWQPDHDVGAALCIFPDPPLDLQTIELPSGCTLMMYTDGGTDAFNAEENFFGLENLKKMITKWLDSPVQVLCDEVIAALLDYQKEAQFDDVTLVALRAC
ncbi:MAG TPA: SpoIIE family protein phosphatase [Anaerolineales bacterium]|nr:SpoIIE family protein phosphatase [Anaerolineales bacterium]